MFKMKQIAMVAILGLALVLATATVFATTQSAHAITVVENNGGNPGSASAQNSQGNQNQGNTAGSTPSGGASNTGVGGIAGPAGSQS